MTTAVEKVILYDGKPEKWPMARRKFTAIFNHMSYGFVYKKALMNSPEVQEQGQKEEDVWIGAAKVAMR